MSHTTVASHQTVRLRRGRHRSPEQGACVMELASMLAGERFTDMPASVCPVLAAFMRTYNDAVGDEPRQDLYAFAARAVGTAGDGGADRRAELCRMVVDSLVARRPPRFRWPRGHGERAGVATAVRTAKALARRPDRHATALILLAALVGGDEVELELAVMADEGVATARR